MLNALAAKREKLKSVETKESQQAQPLLCEDSATYKKMMEETFLEEYFSEIEQFSFASEFFNLDVDTAKAINDAHKVRAAKNDPNPAIIKEVYDDSPLLLQLASRIDEAASKLSTPNFFIRLSTRRLV